MQAGEMVGDYQILRPLGEGGMATVFVARDTRSDREVVLKAMPPYLNSPSMEARFRREIQAIASLDHPNTVKVIEFSVTSTLAWYVMPYVPAVDLEKYAAELRAGAPYPPPATFSRLRTIIMDTASALAHCHERGVFHRDIKPANILVDLNTRRGILSDFGLARAADLTNLTKSREMLGTLRYMSPEMLKSAEVDGPSDIYQLALVTYEIFAGQLPFSGDNPYEELKRRHTEPIPSIRTFNPAVSEEFSEFVVRGMSPAIEDRPSTMEIFREGLKSCPLESRPSRAQVTPRSVTVALQRSQELSTTRIQAELKRRLWLKRAGYALVATALVAGAWKLRSLRPADPEAPPEPVAVLQLAASVAGERVSVSFDTTQPVRARLLKGVEPFGPELDREPATHHAGELPLTALPDPQLRVALTDASGQATRLDLGSVAVPTTIPDEVTAALTTFDIDRLFKEISLGRWRKEGREKLAEHLRQNQLARVLAATAAFRPLSALYFASQAVPLPKRMATYAAFGVLYNLEGLLVREQIPIRFDMDGLLGPWRLSPTSSIAGASALSMKLIENARIKFNNTKDLRKLASSVYDTIEATEGRPVTEATAQRELRGIRDLRQCELKMTISSASRDTYFSVEINGRYRLFFFPPNYAKVFGRGPPVVLHHAFDPRLLEDGTNRFRVVVQSVCDFPFSRCFGDIDSVELTAQ